MNQQESLKNFYTSLSLTLLIVFIVGFISMPREEYSCDPQIARLEAVSLINNGSLDTPDSIAANPVTAGEHGQYFFENSTKHKYYSKYGILNTLIYVPVLFILKCQEGSLDYVSSLRVFYLNIFNLLLAMASAAYLYLIATRYTKRTAIIILFILSAFYCTYWWNYLRAQSSEIYQTLFMLGFYYHVISAGDSKKSKNYFLAAVFLGALILTKALYLILLPLVGLLLIANEWIKKNQPGKKVVANLLSSFFWFSLPIAVAMGVLLFINNYKFGSPFETGYGQWGEKGKPMFSGNILEGLHGFLFAPQQSIFLHFPILIFALFGYRYFLKNYRVETYFFLSLGVLLLLVNSKFLGWSGGWSYGPRYMLVVLPLLSLPFLQTLEMLASNLKKLWVIGAIIIILLSLLYSFQLQLNVNALPFFEYFNVEYLMKKLHEPEVDLYFSSRHLGIIGGDFLVFKKGGEFKPIDLLSSKLFPESLNHIAKTIRLSLTSNYYFFPDKPATASF